MLPLVADLICVFAFAAAGKSSHEVDDSNWVVLVIAWPFVVAVVAAHLLLFSRGQETRRVWTSGVVVVGMTYVVGMLLRALSGRGMDPAFLIVAAIFRAATMLGWRGVAQVFAGRDGVNAGTDRRS